MWVVHHLPRNSTEIGPFVLLEMALSIHEIELQFPKPYQTVKSEKCETFSVSKLAIDVKKNGLLASGKHGNSLVVHGVSLGRSIF